MAKKRKAKAPVADGTILTPKEPAYHRVNFLLQAALRVSVASGGGEQLARRYLAVMSDVCKKAQVKLHPQAKRLFCKRCSTPFVVGKNCRLSTVNKGKQALQVRCQHCASRKRFIFNDARPSSAIETAERQ